MRAGLVAASAVALAQLAIAQPRAHGHAHRHLHERDVAQVTTTIVLPEVIVYVDEDGKTLGAETKAPESTSSSSSASTSTSVATPSSSSSSSSSAASTPSVSAVEAFAASTSSSTSSAPQTTSSTTPPPSSSAAATSKAPASSSTSSASSSSGSSGGGGYSGLSSVKGVAYSPYNSDGTCKDSGSVSSDVASLASQGFGAIRLYGVDCSQISNAVPAARKSGLSVIAGVFNLGSVTSDLSSMASQLNNDFSGISAVTVYNEPLNNGQADASTVASAIREAKSFLKSTNFSGGVAGVDTFNQLLKSSNSAVIEASDFVAANCHAWFDTTCAPSGAANFVHNSCIEPLTAIAGGKPVVITESGWPCFAPAGIFGANIASTDAQSTAMSQLMGIPGVFAFSPFSTKWHKTPDSVENFWAWGDC